MIWFRKYIGLHIALLLWLALSGALMAQEDVLIIDGDHIIFRLQRSWDGDKRVEIAQQYALDTALVRIALKQPESTVIDWEGDQWTVTCTNATDVCLSKGIGGQISDRRDGGLFEKLSMIFPAFTDNNGYYNGAGYVDQARVAYGFNRQKGIVIEQMTDGVICYAKGFESAREVRITGSFTDWSTTGMVCEKTPNGWRAKLQLPPGKYLYKYIVDGKWAEAPNNLLREDDGQDGQNSVMYVYNHTFRLSGYTNARKVVVASSLNDWNEKEWQMQKSGDYWLLPIYLKTGTHGYKFIVDGKWMTDPANELTRKDGGGNVNSVVEIGDPYLFEIKGFGQVAEMKLAGSFNSWNEDELLMTRTATGWELPYALDAGNYAYKFIADGRWMVDPNNPFQAVSGGEINSFLVLEPNHTFQLHGYADAKKVIVSGNFTDWSELNYPMVRRGDVWEFPIHLQAGKCTYKFIVDGDWIRDPANPNYEPNEYSSFNSVLWVEPEGAVRVGMR